MSVRRAAAAALLVAAVCALGACRKVQAAARPDAGPSLVVRSDTEGLLFTWIDDKGDFHVETRVADVPMMGRDAVRVVDPRAQGDRQATGDDVAVVDLRQPGADGTYPVRAMTRAAFEAMAVARREKAGPTLASAGPAAPSAGGGSGAAAPAKVGRAVIIYGAEWCGACHDAAKYLRRKGVPYVDKDIEKDPAAEREMERKLAQNGLNAGSIPVIDVRGKVLVGFDPGAIDAALGQAL